MDMQEGVPRDRCCRVLGEVRKISPFHGLSSKEEQV